MENRLEQILSELKEEVQTVSNEVRMIEDFASGLHYAIVDHVGYLRNGLGLSHEQWIHLTILEIAKLVTTRVMGSVEYMRSLRQRLVS